MKEKQRMTKKKPELKEYSVRCDISGMAYVFVKAENEEDALEKARNGDFTHEVLDHWNFEEFLDAEENE